MRILLVRADGVGDALACAPLVAALGAAGHELGAVLGTGNREIFATRAFAHVHVLERIPWPRHGATPESERVALAGARGARYDAALVASEEMNAYRFARDAGIATRVGFVNGWEKPLKTVRVLALLTRAVGRAASAARAREHEVETMFRLGRDLVTESQPTRDVRRLRELILDYAPAPGSFVALQTSTKLAAAGLDRAAYVALARELTARGRSLRVFGDDPPLVRAVAEACESPAFPSISTGAWKAHLAAARAIVTPDSGAAHVAGMLGIPCVDCFAPSGATARNVARWHPWTSRYRALVLDPVRERTATGAAIARAVDDVLGEGGA